MRSLLLLLVLLSLVEALTKDSIERLIKDIAFGRIRREGTREDLVPRWLFLDAFLSSEYNYEKVLEGADDKIQQLIPFKDISNDSYFKVGVVDKDNLENYTMGELTDELQRAKNKPWIPVDKVQEEMLKCEGLRYGAMSEHTFQYDKGMFGSMNLMKFSCSLVGDQFFVFGMSFGRTRFRLKPVYLRRLNRYWATSLRSITTRDVQKIVDLNSLFFAEHTQEKFLEEVRKLTREIGEEDEDEDMDLLLGKKKDEFIKILPEIKHEIRSLFSKDLNHTTSHGQRGHTFNAVHIPIITRVLIVNKQNVTDYVDEIPEQEASNDTRTLFKNCSDAAISRLDVFNKTAGVGDKHEFVKERALCAAVDKEDALLIYSHSEPTFEFETTMKRTLSSVVEMKQSYNGETEELWRNLLNQQLSHAFFMHHVAFL